MFVFGNDQKSRGCFHVFNIHETIPQGASLLMPDGSIGSQEQLPDGSAEEPLLVTGVEFAHKEKYHLVECFDDTVHTYAFGFDPKSSLVTVNFTAMLIKKDGSAFSQVFTRFLDQYKPYRLSQNQKYATVLFGSERVLRGFLVAMSSSTAADQFNLQNFSMTLLAVEAQ
jgi:hypothetical protein